MKIHEYQARELFKRYGIPVNEGRLVSSGPEARSASRAAGWKQTVVKAQVLAGGRGKAGGVKLARTPDEVEEKARGILGLEIKGYPVEKVLVCDAVEIAREIYLGMVLDRSNVVIVDSVLDFSDEALARLNQRLSTIAIVVPE